MHGISAVDELALVREQIAKLRRREGELQAQVLSLSPEARVGRWHRAECVERSVRVFDHRLLPPQWRDDPLFWRDRTMTQLRCVPLWRRKPMTAQERGDPLAGMPPRPVETPVIEGRALPI